MASMGRSAVRWGARGYATGPSSRTEHAWSAHARATRSAYLQAPHAGSYHPVPALYEPPPIAADHHVALNFLRSAGPDGRPRFASDLVFSKEDRAVKGLVYFGRHTQGPPGCVHGGALAAVFDNMMGWLVWLDGHFAATANLNVNYQAFVPLEAEVLFTSRITKIEDRKIFVEAEMHSLDGDKAHGNAKALFIHLKHAARPATGPPPRPSH